MNRKEFLKSIGATAALAVTYSCLGACSGATEIPQENPITGVIFTINLADPTASALQNKGGYLIKNNIIVAKDMSGNYVAATVVCSHEQKKQIIFRNGEYYCTAHGARFNTAGVGLNGDASRGLKTYSTSLEGNILTVSA